MVDMPVLQKNLQKPKSRQKININMIGIPVDSNSNKNSVDRQYVPGMKLKDQY
jgi:hypothetical protein